MSKFSTLGKLLALVSVISLCLTSGAMAGDKTKKTPKKLHKIMMKKVVNKGTYNHKGARETIIMDDGGGEGQIPSTDPVDKDILSRMKVSEAITPETTDLLGERIDLNSGSVSFKHTDVSIPGNSGLEVAIRRVFKGNRSGQVGMADFSDWDLDIPRIHTTLLYFNKNYAGGWGDGYACSNSFLNPGIFDDRTTSYSSYQYWNGDTLNVPGHVNDKLMLPTSNLLDLGGNTAGITRVTKSNWRIKCEDRLDANGVREYEGFKAYAPGWPALGVSSGQPGP